MKSILSALIKLGIGLAALAGSSCSVPQLEQYPDWKHSENPFYGEQLRSPKRLLVSNSLSDWNRLRNTTEISDPAIIRNYVNIITRTKKREPIVEYNHQSPVYIVALDQRGEIIVSVVSDMFHSVFFPMKVRSTPFGFVVCSVDRPATVGFRQSDDQADKQYWGLPAKGFLSQVDELRRKEWRKRNTVSVCKIEN